jgi:hypothetical protein
LPLDPQIKALLDRAAGLPEIQTLAVAEAREMMGRRVGLMAPPAAVGVVADRTVAGPGGPLALRIYTPATPGPHPLLVFFHGSGFVLCSLDTHDGMCRICARAPNASSSPSIIVSHRSTSSRPPSTIACLRPAGRRFTPRNSALVPTDSPSPATAPAAISPQPRR